jgi:hypothetical protein
MSIGAKPAFENFSYFNKNLTFMFLFRPELCHADSMDHFQDMVMDRGTGTGTGTDRRTETVTVKGQ